MKAKSQRARFRAGLRWTALAGVASLAGLVLSGHGNAQSAPPIETAIYRITPGQYVNIIADVFGDTVRVGGRFDPGVRVNGLIAASANVTSISASGMEQFVAMGKSIAEQVVDKEHRQLFVPCKPQSEKAPDDACAGQFLSDVGRLLFRRPLSGDELSAYVQYARASTTSSGDFHAGLATALSGMLVSPKFLFWREVATPDAAAPGGYKLDGYSKAAKLSFFLWDTAPDNELLRAAEAGELDTQKGLQKQVDRLLNAPRLESGTRAFFRDFLHFDAFANLSKDATIYPNFTPETKDAAQEQTLRTIVDHLLVRRGDYRGLFTTRQTFLTPMLGTIYGVPVPKTTPRGWPEEWVPFEFAENDPRGAGILTHASFVSLHSHPGRSSPTIRGKALREVILCQKVPDPPGNVDFAVLQDTSNPDFKTARARLDAHATQPMCAGCHKITDPMGLALENFDTAANFRTDENGVPLDTSGTLDGVSFTDAPSLGQTIHDHPQTALCLTKRLYEYGLGRAAPRSDDAWVKELVKRFGEHGFRVPDLMRVIALSDKFYEPVSPPATKG